MDRKSLLGLAIIAMMLYLFLTWNKNSGEDEAERQRIQDSTTNAQLVEQKKQADAQKKREDSLLALQAKDSTFSVAKFKEDQVRARMGVFFGSVSGTDQPIVLQNNLIKATTYSRGGEIGQVELKGVQTSSGKPLLLFTRDSSRFALEFFDAQRRQFKTDSLYFTAAAVDTIASAGKPASVTYRLYTDNSKSTYIEYKYTLKENDYMVGLYISMVNCENLFSSDTKFINLQWSLKYPNQEKNIDNERHYSTVYYRFNEDKNIENLSETSTEAKDLVGALKWVGFKQQYFSSIIIANQKFDYDGGGAVSVTVPTDPFTVKTAGATLPIPFGKSNSEVFGLRFYFGPNDYHQLESYHLMLEREIYLGWGIFRWINKNVFMPVFDWLNGFNWSLGLTILLLTIIVKILLFPVAYKSYLSSAKMRVLKPEMDAMNEKYKEEDPMKKQQATMELYRKAGVNPAAGCVPLLLQIPVLFALLRLFPALYDLRQHGFWWANDLSTYDSIWEFGFNIPGYGDHMSLWALLMTISTLLYTWMNQQTMSTGPQLPGMKWLIYIMPLFFLSFLNKNSAALSYYYFISNMITFGQMALMRRFVDEKAIRAKMENNKKKPQKAGLLQRLEQAQRQRMDEVRQQQGKGGKKKK